MIIHDVKLWDLMEDKKCGIVSAYSPDSSYVHQSFLTADSKIISFEFMPCNYPAASLTVWESEEAYAEAIEEVDWILENADIPETISRHFKKEA